MGSIQSKAWLAWYHALSEQEKKLHNQQRYRKYKTRYNNNSAKWAKANPHKGQAAVHNCTVKKNYPELWAATDITNAALADWLLKKRGQPCVYCGDPAYHIDHIVPLSKGGPHTWKNIQLVCKFCNIAKLDYTEEEFKEHILAICEHR